MTKLVYVVAFIGLAFFGCTDRNDYDPSAIEENQIKEIEGLTMLSENWIQDSTRYWSRANKDSTWKQLKVGDTSTVSDFTIIEVHHQEVNDHLTITKFIDIDPKSTTKISETDRYTKKLNRDLESRLTLTYDYNSEEYYADFIDSVGTEEKRRANEEKAENAAKTAEEGGLYLCGTAYNAILWEDIPFLPVPKEITKDSALYVIKEWADETH